MKILHFAATLFVAAAFFVTCIGAQEIPAPPAEGLVAPPIPWSPFVDKSVDDMFSKSSENPAELINSGTYAFSAQSGIALENMSTGTTQLIAAGSFDSQNSGLAPIGFLFRFDGGSYTTFGVSLVGVARLGSIVTGSNRLNIISSTVASPKIVPYWDDLCVGNSGKVHYKRVGTPGNQKLVVEWKNMKISRGTACDGTGTGTFQMWLFDRSGIIQFVYGPGMNASSAANGGYSVGIQSGAATNFSSVTTGTSSVSYTTVNDTQFDAIAAGTSYLFSPNIPTEVTGLNASPVTSTSVTLNWRDNANNETGYLVRRTTDNVAFYFVGTLPPNSTTFTDTGLEPDTSYTYYVNAFTEGAFGADVSMLVTTTPPMEIASTAAGGNWSAPSTWVSGVVPALADNVTIASGTTVIIDTAAVARNVTVGNTGSREDMKGDAAAERGAPAILRFGESAAFSLTVTQNVTIGPNDIFSTGGGTVNQHVLNVGGDLINNGTLDFSTNNNAAGAAIRFTGASNNIFGGTGAVTDVMAIIMAKGISNVNILELAPSNFTVQGSSTETPASGYLFLYGGTFKISGTFTGTHRTFPAAAYEIPRVAGFWLNNPNYTVTAQNASASIVGLLRVSAGTYNVGTATADSLLFQRDSSIVIEGGNVNTAGVLRITQPGSDPQPFSYNQSGGIVTTCTVGRSTAADTICFDMSERGSISMTGGEIFIQNASSSDSPVDYRNKAGWMTGTTVHFGNALTTPGSTFRAIGLLPNIVVDTVAGPQTLRFPFGPDYTRDVNIGPGGKLDFVALRMSGTTFINNGILAPRSSSDGLLIDDGTGLSDCSYSGVGVVTGYMGFLYIRCRTFTFDPAGDNFKVGNFEVHAARVINTNKVTLGNGSSNYFPIALHDGASFDTAPDFNLGTGWEGVEYGGLVPFITGPEIKPDRILGGLSIDGTAATSVTIDGGDLTATGGLFLQNGVIHTGPHTLTSGGTFIDAINGYVDGRLRRELTGTGLYRFLVGQNGKSTLSINVTSLGVNPTYVTVTAIDAFMPGLLPATSASRYWKVETDGDFSGTLTFTLRPEDINGNQAGYHRWRSINGGPPVISDGTGAISNPSGIWGFGTQLDPSPVSVSGRVTTSSGNPIRNATVTISGGGLPAPITVFTGSLGTYVINGLQAGNTYNVQASAKRYRFPAGGQQVTPFGNVANIDFAANLQEEF